MSKFANESHIKDKERGSVDHAPECSPERTRSTSNPPPVSSGDMRRSHDLFWIAQHGESSSAGQRKSIISLINKVERDSTHRVNAYMAQFGLTVDDIGTEIYTELPNVLSDRNKDTTKVFADQDFENLAFPVPPPSPSQYGGPKEILVLDPTNANKRHEPQRVVDADDVLNLFNMEKLREMQFVNEGCIKEWWTENRLEWIENKEQFDRCQNALDITALQQKRLQKLSIKNLETLAATENLDRLAHQRQSLLFEMNFRLQIFAAYKMCMMKAIHRLELIQGNAASPSTPSFKLWPGEYDISWFQPGDSERVTLFMDGISKARWYNLQDFPQWLTGAAGSLDYMSGKVPIEMGQRESETLILMKNHEVEEAKIFSLRTEQRRQDALFDTQIAFMEQNQNLMLPENGISDSRRGSVLKDATWKEVINKKKHEKNVQHDGITDRLKNMYRQQSRNSILCKLKRKQIDDYKDYICLASSLSRLMKRIHRGQNMFLDDPIYEAHYHAIYKMYRLLSVDMSDVLHMEQEIPSHLTNDLTADHEEKLKTWAKEYAVKGTLCANGIEQLAQNIDKVDPEMNFWKPLHDFMKTAESAFSYKCMAREQIRRWLMIKDHSPGNDSQAKIQSTEKPHSTSRRRENRDWGNVPDVDTASQVLCRLEEDLNGKWLELRDLLFQFYVSPDIAHVFETMIGDGEMPREGFFDLTNSLITKKLHRVELEAFLMCCHESDHLFKYSQEKKEVYLCDAMRGWEFVHEMPVAGLPREWLYIVPLKTQALEERLIYHQKACKLDTYGFDDRDIEESRFIAVIKSVWRDKPLEDGEIQNILSFWHSTGKMFTLLGEKSSKGERLYKRLDNGWPPSDHNLYARLGRSGKHYNYIKELITNNLHHLVRLIYDTEHGKPVRESDIYSMLKNLLVFEGWLYRQKHGGESGHST